MSLANLIGGISAENRLLRPCQQDRPVLELLCGTSCKYGLWRSWRKPVNSERLYKRSRPLLRVGIREANLCLFVAPRQRTHAATLADSRKTSAFLNREADIHELLRMNVDAPWERSFQFRPFAVDVFGAYGDGATAILQQLARRRSEHTSMTVGACKRLAFQSLSVTLQTANARMLRSRKALVAPLSFPPLSTTRSSEVM
jgi:hypothetical protein